MASEFQVKKTNVFYKSINIYSAQDPNLTDSARGIMFYFLSLPNDWKGQIYDLEKKFPHGRKHIKNVLRTLRENGYIELKQFPKVDGKFQGSYYIIYDQPQPRLITKNPKNVKSTFDGLENIEFDF